MCCVEAVVKNCVFLALECWVYACVRGVMNIVISVCIVRHGAVGVRV